MGSEHTMWLPWVGMWIIPVILGAVLIIGLCMVMGRWGCGSSRCRGEQHHGETRQPESASDILNKRYAGGEISKLEFEQLKDDISGKLTR